MTKKQIWINIIILVFTYFVPIYFFKSSENNYANIDLIQKAVFILILLGSITLFYKNNKNRKQIGNPKWLWLFFETVGILGGIYSIGVLYLIFSFKDGIGF